MGGDKKKIFIIEDEFMKKVSLAELLQKEGFEIIASSDEKPMDEIVKAKPDIVITDVDISAGLGRETGFISEIKENKELKETEIFVYTEKLSVGLEVQLRKHKLDNYFTKGENTDPIVKGCVRHFAPVEEDIPLPGDPTVILDVPAAAPKEKTDEEQFDEMFTEFSDKVHEQLGDKDGETIYNLGISYMDMGLHKEAIKEFQMSANDENFKLESASMIGVCLRNLKKYNEAVSMFQKGAKMTEDPVEVMGFRYEIGVTLQEMGKLKDAFKFFGAVYKADKSYRDVHQRLVDIKSSLQAQKG